MPNEEQSDNVTCYLCNKSLDGWEPKDNPWKEHVSHSASCPFVYLQQLKSGNQVAVMDQKVFLQARLKTFEGVWPHDAKGWSCSSKKVRLVCILMLMMVVDGESWFQLFSNDGGGGYG
jgi:hypothetical protein